MGWFDRWFPWSRPVVHPTRAQIADSRAGVGLHPYTRHVVRTDSLINEMTGLGSDNDKSAVARPNRYVVPLDDEELLALYNFNGLANRAVNILPTYATREGWKVEGAESSDEKRLQIRARVTEAMTVAQLFGNAAMLLVTIDDVRPDFRGRAVDWLAEPLDMERIGELRAIHVFDTFEASPLDLNSNPSSTYYRQAEFWQLSSLGFSARVHASRVVTFRGRHSMPSRRWARSGLGPFGSTARQQDQSYLQAIYDQIRHLGETMQGGAVLAQELQRAVYKIAGLDSITSGDQAVDLVARLRAGQQAAGVLGATAIGAQDDLVNLAGTPTGFKDLSEGAMAMFSMVTGIPQLVWFGEAPSGLSTDGDSAWKGFRQIVSTYQEQNRTAIERIYEVLGAAQDSDSTIDPEDVSLTYNPLDEPSDQQQAETRLTNAKADAVEIKSGVLRPEETRKRYTDENGYRMELGALPEKIPPAPEPEVPPALPGDPAQPALPGQPPTPQPPAPVPSNNDPNER